MDSNELSIEERFKPGTQIIYVPTHVDKDISHPACEKGFVTSIREKGDGDYVIFCRYWSLYRPKELRTVANSEGTPPELLIIKDTHPQADVDAILKMIQEGKEPYGPA